MTSLVNNQSLLARSTNTLMMATTADEGKESGSAGEHDGRSSPSPPGEIAPPQHSTGVKRPTGPRVVSGTQALDIPLFERMNWLIHQHYIRKDFEQCKVLIRDILVETDDQCEYALYIHGLILRQEGNIPASLELFQRAVQLNPNSSSSVKQVARSLFLLGRHKAALDVYSEALHLSNHQDWEVIHNQGVCYTHLKNYAKAEEHLRSALELTPQTITYMQLGRVFLLQNKLSEATEVYQTAVKHSPENSDLLSTLGLLYLQVGATQKAFEYLGSAMTYDPQSYKAILAAGATIQCHGDYDVALTKYRLVSQSTSESAHLWNNIGMCFFGKKKNVAAISCLKRANYLAPLEWRILYNLGLVHLTQQQYASAFHFLSAAHSLHSSSHQLMMLLAVTLKYLGDLENSLKAYEQAVTLNKNDYLVHLNYAITLYHTGHMHAAAKQYKRSEEVFSRQHPDENGKRKKRSDLGVDPEVLEVRTSLGAALQLGEQLVNQKPPPASAEEMPKEKPKEEEETNEQET